MQIDSFTVLFCGLFVKATLSVLFLTFWFNERRSGWYVWWSATFLMGGAASALFMLRGHAPDFLTMGLGNSLLIAAFACAWQGVRVFERRKPLWLPVLIAPSLWLAACFVPRFMEDIAARVVYSSALIAPLLAMGAFEFWRGRGEALPSRWPLIAMFMSFSLFFLLRIPFVGLLPFPFGALPMHPGWLGAFNLAMFFHTIIITVLIVAMTKERLEQDQRHKAQTDPLTGVPNRRAFEMRSLRMSKRHAHSHEPLCILVLDIDRFKLLNDRHGHRAGDDALMRFASIVHEAIRPSDLLFRIGGEEFCCLLPSTDEAQGAVVAERLRRRVEAEVLELPGVTTRMTVSVGLASSTAFGYDIDMLMQQADHAVYEAKRQGRNRVVIAGQGREPTLLLRQFEPAAPFGASAAVA
jgi:diguanylate cyclase (GGDEF)-like protein